MSKLLLGLLANEWLLAAVIFVVTRAVALFGGYVGVVQLIQEEPHRSKGWLAELTLMWDSAWYMGIAQNGYHWDPNATGGTDIAFPPLYPMLMRGLSWILDLVTFGWDWGNPTYGSYIAAGLLISNISFFLALVLLFKLVTPMVGRTGAAIVTLAFASLPLAFFFSAIYTEGLFVLLLVGAFWVARTEWRYKWLAVGVIGLFASLIKFAGILLLPILIVEYMVQHRWSPRRIRADLLWLALVPLGLALYLGFLWWRFDTPQVLLETQKKGWNHQASYFWQTYWDDGVMPLWRSVAGEVPPDNDWVLFHGSGNRLYAFLDAFSPIVLLLGGLAARRKLGPAEWTLLVLGIIFPLSSNTANSLTRYMLPLWPGLVWLGMLRGRWRVFAGLWIGASLVLLGWCSAIYGGGKWIG